MNHKTTIDAEEVAKFATLSDEWWNPNGPLKTLHDINPTRLEFIQKWVKLSEKRVMDVGCGGGILCEGLAESGAAVTGLDVEPDTIAAARQHAEAHDRKIEYVCEAIEAYQNEPFDIVTCMEMLEHVPDPELVIEQCARLLKPGGYLFFSTINRTLKAYATAILAAEYLLGILPRGTHDFKKLIKPSELAAMVRKAGLEVLGIAGLSYNPVLRSASIQDSVSVNYLMVCRL